LSMSFYNESLFYEQGIFVILYKKGFKLLIFK